MGRVSSRCTSPQDARGWPFSLAGRPRTILSSSGELLARAMAGCVSRTGRTTATHEPNRMASRERIRIGDADQEAISTAKRISPHAEGPEDLSKNQVIDPQNAATERNYSSFLKVNSKRWKVPLQVIDISLARSSFSVTGVTIAKVEIVNN